MKNFIILFVLLLSFGAVNTFATCPTGYMSATRAIGPDSHGCTWSVTFCYKCPITGLDPADIIIDPNGVISTTPDCTTFDKDELANLIVQDFFNNLCTIPYCDGDCNHSRVISISFPVCYQYHIVGFYVPPSPTLQLNSYIQSCSAGYCTISYRACRQHVAPNLIVRCPGDIVPISYTLHDVTCDTEPFVNLPTNKAFWPQLPGDNPYGGCFQLVQDCVAP